MEFNRDLISGCLREGLVEIEFTKLNGESRTMICTLNEEYIPAINIPKEDTNLKKTAEHLPVYEIDNGWRSFRWNSLKSWVKKEDTYR